MVYPRKVALRAFTLPELMVVLILTSALIVTLYYSYLFFNQQMIRFEQNLNESAELSSFYSQLYAEFDEAQNAISLGSGFKLMSNQKEIIYTFQSGSMTRKADNISSIAANNMLINSSFDNKPAPSGAFCDRVSIKFTYNSRMFYWVFNKTLAQGNQKTNQ